MSLLVVGSVAYDTIETVQSKVIDALGGSATYISLAASYFTNPVHLVGVVGSDFKKEHIDLLSKKNVDLKGLQIVENGKTFRWSGRYHKNFNDRDTISTDLNVFETFNPIIPDEIKNDDFIMLGNIDPPLQLNVLEQINKPKLTVLDTMNLWINIKKMELLEVLKNIDVLIINDSEAELLTSEANLVKAAKQILNIGMKYLIIKKGAHGAVLFDGTKVFSAPAYPLENLVDPTGAGDTFAGGFLGYLSKQNEINFEIMRKAVVYGSVMASFCCEDFSTSALENLNEEKIQNRFDEFAEIARF